MDGKERRREQIEKDGKRGGGGEMKKRKEVESIVGK